jgi:hypothetical protein
MSSQMKIEWLEQGYTRHGCKILPSDARKVGMVNYNAHTTNYDFGGAFRRGGLYEWMDKAEALVKKYYPDAVIRLSIPDLVFEVPSTEILNVLILLGTDSWEDSLKLTGNAHELSLAQWIELARDIKGGKYPTAGEGWLLCTKIQILLVNAGLISDQAFVDALQDTVTR